MFHDQDARREHGAMHGARRVRDVVDVDAVDADKRRPLLDKKTSGLGGEERVLGRAVLRGAPVPVPASTNQ